MMERSPDIARSAFDTVAAAQKAGTIAELNDVMAGSMEAVGFNVCVRVNLLDAGGVLNFAVTFGRTHEGAPVAPARRARPAPGCDRRDLAYPFGPTGGRASPIARAQGCVLGYG